ncbi:methyltransferase domain-containing protein [archaeon]|jgi:2-polyprenyl-3-methyl-5-hydroxy-6-metoxy-1,4-benzoquinol methylase|nr:methyltransferase domain-containing protein [archaeon]MBT6761868.1 methyltransferase domain-containing protein [archaeon]
MSNNHPEWWSEEYSFFGDFYMEGDDSKEGYRIAEKQNLKQRTLTEVDGVLRLLDLKSKSKLLDCPTGYGRHSIELAKRGFVVTGSDLNSKHLEVAKKEAKKNSAKIQFVKENMFDLDYDSEFDAVINMFYSFGFFESDEDNFKVLQNFFKALKPNGQFLMHTDVNIPFIQAGEYKHDETRALTNGNALRIVDKYNPDTKRINGFWILKDENGEEIKKEYSVRVYTKEEFIDLCKKAGFRFCKAYSDWNKKSYSEDSEDMIIVATK